MWNNIAIGDRYTDRDEPPAVWCLVGVVQSAGEPYALLLSDDRCRFREVRARDLMCADRFVPVSDNREETHPLDRPGQGNSGASEAQGAVVAYLASAEAHGGEVPEHIETHLSHVFLTGERAYKLKRARHWSVVDYSSVALREHYCRKEFQLNARFAPGLYLGVRPVTFDGAAYAVDGAGDVVDWLVEMRRFPHEAQLDVMADAGTLTPDLVDRTADAIAELHAGARRVPGPGYGERVRELGLQLERDLLAQPGSDRLNEGVARWAEASAAQLHRNGDLLDARGAQGFVRRCHGDLHLSNICLWQGRPTPFDAIEFSEEIATIDVMYDLAFVLVDLEHRGRMDLSSRLLSRYLETSRDYGGLALVPLFKGLRSMVRALVGATKGREAAPYVAAACVAAEWAPSPRLIAVGGRSGSGKTTVARALAPRIGAVVLRSDTTRKRLAGVAEETPLPPSAYGAEASAAVYERMRRDAAAALGAGWPVILDATFLDPGERSDTCDAAEALGVPFTGVWLSAARDTLLDRVKARVGDASDADAAVVSAQSAREMGPLDWTVVDAEGGPEQVATTIAETLLG